MAPFKLLRRWLHPCTGRLPAADASPPGAQPRQIAERAPVYIDRTTKVPVELYFSLLQAGDRARARGQHLKPTTRPAVDLQSCDGNPCHKRIVAAWKEAGT
mmetsp:Transcript_35175/g.76821  ORF Transcript_35175/g.76821 Transcript_35175/m.76821 type:complete len:101 (+) Transcript_35175:59-361(+)